MDELGEDYERMGQRGKIQLGYEAYQMERKGKAQLLYEAELISKGINGRFFKALRLLHEGGQIKSIYQFTKEHGINGGNFYQLEKDLSRTLPSAYLVYLVSEYNVSAHWLLTGEGDMMRH